MKNRTVGADSISAQKGITLVALVITIIVLLILAGVVISLALGQNGILKIGKRATEKHKIESIREEVELAMLDYKARAVVVDEEVTIESVLQELVGKEVFDSIDKPEQIGVVGEYDVKLKYNENHEVVIEYIQKATGVRITYKLQPAGYTNQAKVDIVFKVTGKVKSVTNPKGLVAYPKDSVIALDYEVEANGRYLFKVENEEGIVTDKEVIVDTIDTEIPVSCDITVTTTSTGFTIQATAEDAPATDASVKSGIDYFEYYVNGEKKDSNEITGLSQGTYTVYAKAFDKAGNPKQSEEQTVKITRKIAKIASGRYHNLAIDIEGNLWAWGSNGQGQLGDGTKTARTAPIPIKEGTKFKEVSSGWEHSFAIDEEGNLWGWGSNEQGQLGDGTKITRTVPVPIKEGTKFKQVSTGYYHTVAIDEEGNLWSWGSNAQGRLGDGTTTARMTPVQIKEGTKFKQVATGQVHSLAIDEIGSLWVWGFNAQGVLGNGGAGNITGQYWGARGQSVPMQIEEETKFEYVTTSNLHCFAVDEEGNLLGWGNNDNYEIGDGTTTDRTRPVQVKEEIKFKKVATGTGGTHSLAIDREGKLWGWASNAKGQVGDGTRTARTTPVQIKEETRFKEIAGGAEHSLAIDEAGTLWAWGNNDYGQLGDRTTTTQLTPIQIF